MALLLSLFCFLSLASAKYATGSAMNSDSQWFMIEKFNFEREGGSIMINVTSFNDALVHQKIALYHDWPGVGYDKVATTMQSCQKKLEAAAKILPLSTIGKDQNYKIMVTNARPRWWYVVVTNCPTGDNPEVVDPAITKTLNEDGVFIENYEVRFLNDGGKFQAEFNVSDQGIFECEIFVLIALLVLVPLTFFMHFTFTNNGKTSTAAAIRWILLLECLALIDTILMVADLDKFSNDGIGMPLVADLTALLTALIHLALVGVFLLMSKGMWIAPAKFTMSRQRSVFELMGIYFIVTIVLLWYAYNVDHPIYDDYIFLTTPGYLIGALRVLMIVFFLAGICSLVSNGVSPLQKLVLLGTAFVGTVWLSSVAILIVVGFSNDDWSRKRILVIVEEIFTLMAYIGLTVIVYMSSGVEDDSKNNAHGFDGIADTDDIGR